MTKSLVLKYLAVLVVLPIKVLAEPPQTPAVTGAQRIFLTQNLPAVASEAIVGSGIAISKALSSGAHIDANGNELFWKVYRTVDAPPMQHVFYRQHLREKGNGRETPFIGGYMVLHFRNGLLTSVMGTQFRTVVLANTVRFNLSDAFGRARARLAERGDFHPEPPARMTGTALAERLKHSNLLLQSTGDGHTFRFVYEVIIHNAQGRAVLC